MAAYDFVVIGAGIAGTSAACELARLGDVLLLEREEVPGYHSTGRSAAVLTENYGVDVIRKLTVASRGFLESPPPGFADHPLLIPRPVLFVARSDQMPRLEAMLVPARQLVPSIRMIDADEAIELCPTLRPEYIAGGLLEPDAMDIDVAAMHQGFLNAFRARGGLLRTNREVVGLERSGTGWTVHATGETISCSTVINAAGAWCDEIARSAGVTAAGLTPKRRTAFVFDVPAGTDADGWPSVIDSDEEFYFKPESSGLLGSPADATPVAACDVQPEMLDIALAIDRIQRATTLQITRVRSKWAGLRTFARDGAPVVGMDPATPGFLWLAGQGGYGIMTAPALSRTVAALVEHGELPNDLCELGLSLMDLGPERLRQPFRDREKVGAGRFNTLTG